MKDYLEYAAFSGLGFFIRLIGLHIARKFSIVLAFIFYYLIPIRKKTTIENLSLAFPEKSRSEINTIAFRSFQSFLISLVEILYIPALTKEEMSKMILCPNKDLIIRKHREGRGIILLSGHFGNWEYIAASMSLQINIPFSVVIKPQRNNYITEWMNKFRTKWSNKVVPLGISIRQIYKELKDKNIVAMVADQRGPQDGIRVNFFGRPVSVYPGPAMLALKTGAPILYGVAIRQPDYSYHTTMIEISLDDLEGTDEEKVVEISRRHTAYLEEMIKLHPEQWLWMHKRWKY